MCVVSSLSHAVAVAGSTMVSSSPSSSSGTSLLSFETSILALRCEAIAEICGFKDFPFKAEIGQETHRKEVAAIRAGMGFSRSGHLRFYQLSPEGSTDYAYYLFFKETNSIGESLIKEMNTELGNFSCSSILGMLSDKSKESVEQMRQKILSEKWSENPGGGYEVMCHPLDPFYMTQNGCYTSESPDPQNMGRNHIFKGFCFSGSTKPVIDRMLNRLWTVQGGEGARVENVTTLIKEQHPFLFPQPLLDLIAEYDGRIYFMSKISASLSA